ncbi:MAG: DinB family protein [Acidobacteriota bacterium]
MGLSNALLPEYDNEMANTRKTLERVPADKFSWTPHAKSSSMGALASHLANLPSWGSLAIGFDSFDMNPGGEPAKTRELTSREAVLETFDKNAAATRAAIEGASDEELFKPWSLQSNGTTLMTVPKVAVLRSFVMNHMIHHRAQLGVYLRLNDIPVPSIYGPSADESPF